MAAMRTGTEDREYLSGGRVIKRYHRPMPGGGSIATYEDIMARDTAERALHEAKKEAELANRSKSEFLANMSHELRTPLNAIIGFSQIIEAQMFGPVEPAQYREYANDIHESGRHLLSLINDILDLSKIEARKYEIRETDVDIFEAVDASVRLVRERADEAGVDLDKDLSSDLPLLTADPRAVKQILLNLLSNAVKFTDQGGRVTVRAQVRADGALAIAVTDTGIGMTPSGIELALMPFGQVDAALDRRYEGTGLGLPLTERLAELHGGSLDVDSQIGVGTTVTVCFPAHRVQRPTMVSPRQRAS
jgi:signal transduction histidine kinase